MTHGPRRSLTRGIGLLLPLFLAHCTFPFDRSHPPYLPRYYASVAGGATGIHLKAGNEESDFPQALAELDLGAYVYSEGKNSTALELGGQGFLPDTGGDLKGQGFRALGSVRQFYALDQRVRLTALLGASFVRIDFHNQPSGTDIIGAGGHAGLGADYMLTPLVGLGIEGRYHLFYGDASGDSDLVGAVDAILRLTFHF